MICCWRYFRWTMLYYLISYPRRPDIKYLLPWNLQTSPLFHFLDIMRSGRYWLTFQRNILPPYSGLKNKPSRKVGRKEGTRVQFPACFLKGLLFDLQDEGSTTYLWNVGVLPKYTALHPMNIILYIVTTVKISNPTVTNLEALQDVQNFLTNWESYWLFKKNPAPSS
jgi:hypothetical protein